MIKKILYTSVVLLIILGGALVYYIHGRLEPTPRISSSPTSIIGFNHIGISVKNLDKMVQFYQEATGYEIIDRYGLSNDIRANKLYGQDSLVLNKVILKGPNMLLELISFDHKQTASIEKMKPEGPGMTHTCYQSHPDRPTYDSFSEAGIDMLTRGSEPVEGLGVSYAYGYDPEGNMVELEEMSWKLIPLLTGSHSCQSYSS